MTVLSYFFSQDVIFHRIKKLLQKLGYTLTGIDWENGVIHACYGMPVIGPKIEVQLSVEFQGESLTRVSVATSRGKSWLNLSEKKLKQFEHRLVEKLYCNVI